MEPQVLIIPGELPGLNEIIEANRANKKKRQIIWFISLLPYSAYAR